MKKHGRFLSNTYDPRKPNARMHLVYSYAAWRQGESAMEVEWQHHLDWINKNVIGPPKATKWWTTKELQKEGLIGIYAHP